MTDKKKKVVAFKNLPSRSPIMAIVVYWIALDHWEAPAWVYGASGALGLFALVSWLIHHFWLEQEVDPFTNDKSNTKP